MAHPPFRACPEAGDQPGPEPGQGNKFVGIFLQVISAKVPVYKVTEKVQMIVGA